MIPIKILIFVCAILIVWVPLNCNPLRLEINAADIIYRKNINREIVIPYTLSNVSDGNWILSAFRRTVALPSTPSDSCNPNAGAGSYITIRDLSGKIIHYNKIYDSNESHKHFKSTQVPNLDTLRDQIQSIYRKTTVKVAAKTTCSGQLNFQLDELDFLLTLQPGDYILQVVYFSSDLTKPEPATSISVVEKDELLSNERIYNANTFFGCLLSNTCKLIVK